jgi:ubiquinone/menaquinone biosynthesis C-methylase UbiE
MEETRVNSLSAFRRIEIELAAVAACPQLEAVPFELVICECGHADWSQQDERGLRCLHCDNALAFQNSVLDCRTREAVDSRTIHQWEVHYQKPGRPYSAANDWLRIATWRKHLFRMLPSNLVDPMVADIGCGTADRVAAILAAENLKCRYLGVDRSQEALEKASRNMPGSLLVRADISSLKLRDGVADVVLCLGVLMYFEEPSPILEKLLRILKPGGFLLLHEARPNRGLRGLLTEMRPTPETRLPDAPGASMANIAAILEMHGKILHRHLACSPFLRPLCRLITPDSPKPLQAIAVGADSLWCQTAGLLAGAVGAAEFQFVFQKNETGRST